LGLARNKGRTMSDGNISSHVKRSKIDVQKKNSYHFIPAYFIEPPDLDLYAALQNLMWYAVECLNSLPSISGRNALMVEHFSKSVSLIESKGKECSSSLDGQLHKLFIRFLEEARKAEQFLYGFIDRTKTPPCPDQDLIPKSAAGEIAATATYLQWLAICLSEELRVPFDTLQAD
jgi:hypothetical protein